MILKVSKRRYQELTDPTRKLGALNERERRACIEGGFGQMTDTDKARILAAQAKRDRRAAKRAGRINPACFGA